MSEKEDGQHLEWSKVQSGVDYIVGQCKLGFFFIEWEYQNKPTFIYRFYWDDKLIKSFDELDEAKKYAEEYLIRALDFTYIKERKYYKK